jgi:uncharacterized protein YjbI with pentapeptide repeats
VSYVTYAKVWGFEKTLEAQKREFVSEEIKAGRFDNSRLAKFHDNVGVIGNLAIGSNIGIYGDLAVARNAGVTGSLAVGDYINAQGVRSSNVFTRNVFAETSSIGEARIDSGNFRYARFNDAGFIGASFSNAGFSNASFKTAGFDNANFNNANFNNASFSNSIFKKSEMAFANITNARIENASFSKFARFNDRTDFDNSICMTDNGRNVCVMSDDISKMKTLVNTDILNLRSTLSPVASQLVGISSNLTVADIQAFKNLSNRLNGFNGSQISLLQNLANVLQGIDLTNMSAIVRNLNQTDINRIKGALQSVDTNNVASLSADQVNKLRIFSNALDDIGRSSATFSTTVTRRNIPVRQKIGMELNVQRTNQTVTNWYGANGVSQKYSYSIPQFGTYKISLDCFINDGKDNIYGEWTVTINSPTSVIATLNYVSNSDLSLFVESNNNLQWFLSPNTLTSNYTCRVTIISFNLGNVVSAVGTMGPTMLIHWGFQDVNPGGVMTFSREPGNTASGWGDPANGVFPVFHWGFLATNSSGENISWNKARLIIRAVNLGDGGGYAQVRVQQYYFRWNNDKGEYRDLTKQFGIVCPQIWRGYMTNISPWFSLITGDVPGIVLRLDSSPNNNVMRFGSIHIQFAA